MNLWEILKRLVAVRPEPTDLPKPESRRPKNPEMEVFGTIEDMHSEDPTGRRVHRWPGNSPSGRPPARKYIDLLETVSKLAPDQAAKLGHLFNSHGEVSYLRQICKKHDPPISITTRTEWVTEGRVNAPQKKIRVYLSPGRLPS
jgi:hypothetical protein